MTGVYFASISNRKNNSWCNYTTRLDTYGCGCSHECSYCYAKNLLEFRGNWNNIPNKSIITENIKIIESLPKNTIVKLGGMTDCFQPIEGDLGITYETIKHLNRCRINYLIVTKGNLVSSDKYIDIYDKKLAHFQISITNTDDNKSFEYEKCSLVTDRIKSIEKLQLLGFDVSIRLSPFIYDYINFDILNNIKCDKILIEFLKVNNTVKKHFKIDLSKYTVKYGGNYHLPLHIQIEMLKKITSFKQKTVGASVLVDYLYYRDNYNYNKKDCCNLNITNKEYYNIPVQQCLFS